MEIPKEFKIMGETITVKFKDDLKVRRDNFGETHHRFNEIWIDSTLSDDIKQHTFWHEFVHIALEKMLEHELSDNEKFVNILGGFINQAMNTKRSNKDGKIESQRIKKDSMGNIAEA